MFSITFEDERYNHWDCDYVFTNFGDAKNYLLDKGFIEKNRIFVRDEFNWSRNLKAYISPRKIYSN